MWKDWVIAILLINNTRSSTDSWATWLGSSESQQSHPCSLEHRSPVRTTFHLCSSAPSSHQVTWLPPSSTQLSEPLLSPQPLPPSSDHFSFPFSAPPSPFPFFLRSALSCSSAFRMSLTLYFSASLSLLEFIL